MYPSRHIVYYVDGIVKRVVVGDHDNLNIKPGSVFENWNLSGNSTDEVLGELSQLNIWDKNKLPSQARERGGDGVDLDTNLMSMQGGVKFMSYILGQNKKYHEALESMVVIGPSTRRNISSGSAFLFSINNVLGLKPFKIDVKKSKQMYAAVNDPAKGPVFGLSDLTITYDDNTSIPRHSESHIDNAYSLPEEYDSKNEVDRSGLLAETRIFTWDDLEVFFTMVSCLTFPGGRYSVKFWARGFAAGTLKPLPYTKTMFSCILQPYSRLEQKSLKK
ncbi:hypothetical protein OS493_034176 [Desmophyllum pertusum]|uniref:Uncharacterized protein n=1 Tax=Desmophyllum pertusum TaxID=174260 RepID=A0A9W9ZW92_9CNID|nr:hypothetical protein OS493_034176 [Desmophyllum pertusum]